MPILFLLNFLYRLSFSFFFNINKKTKKINQEVQLKKPILYICIHMLTHYIYILYLFYILILHTYKSYNNQFYIQKLE